MSNTRTVNTAKRAKAPNQPRFHLGMSPQDVANITAAAVRVPRRILFDWTRNVRVPSTKSLRFE